jgi:hypothetical protein
MGQDLKAGGAYVELMMQDKGFLAGMAAGQSRLLRFAAACISVRGVVDLVKSAFNALTGPIQEFLGVGDALAKMSQRTGVSVESLSELKHAAEQSGSSLEDVEKALKHMAKEGIDVSTFDQVAAGIAAIEDPTKRAQEAMKVWGKSGTALLPMLGDLQALRQEARDMGLVMSGDAANGAVRVGDMLQNLWTTVKAGTMAIGQAVAPFLEVALPAVQAFATHALKAIQTAGAFISSNVGAVATFIGSTWQAIFDYVAPIVGAYYTVIADVFMAVWDVAQSVWGAIGGFITSVWGNISENTGGVLEWLQSTVIGVFSSISFAIHNWKLLAVVALVSAELAIVRLANVLAYQFGTVAPAYLSFIADNWKEVFLTMLINLGKFTQNAGTNLANLWDAIVGLFSGDGWNFEWTSLTDGMEDAFKGMPAIAEREMGALEKDLQGQLDGLMNEVGQKWDDHNSEFKKRIEKNTPANPFASPDGPGGAKGPGSGGVDGALPDLGKKKSEVFASFSAAALQAQGSGSFAEPIVKAINKQTSELKAALDGGIG